MTRSWKELLGRGAETAVSVGLVSLAFLVFVGLLGVVFPQGTSLKELMWREGGARPVSKPVRPGPALAAPDLGPVAKLSRVTRKVKNKQADELVWNNAQSGMALGDRHAVQTLDRSGATIVFDDDGELVMQEQSLVVLKHQNPYSSRKRSPTEVLLLGGELTGTISGRNADAKQVEIVTASSRLKPISSDGSGMTFNAVVHEDGSTTYSVQGGRAAIETGDRTVIVGPQESVTTTERGIEDRAPLPDPPTLLEPVEAPTFYHRTQPPKVEFRWTSDARADRYAFSLSRDETFESIVHDTELTDTLFTHGNLGDGDYFWRVTPLHSRARGRSSEVGHLRVEKDATGPGLDVTLPPTLVTEPEVDIVGTVDAGSRVFVAGVEVAVDESGAFRVRVPLARGANTVIVEAVDSVGNSTYRSSIVHTKYE